MEESPTDLAFGSSALSLRRTSKSGRSGAAPASHGSRLTTIWSTTGLRRLEDASIVDNLLFADVAIVAGLLRPA